MLKKLAAMGISICLMAAGCGGGGGGGGKRRTSPVLDPIPTPQSIQVTQNLHFVVTASDLDGDTPALSAAPLPSNASFTDNGNGTGDFDFTPDLPQQSQIYTITFTADDGVLAPDTQDVVIEVTGIGNGTFTMVGTGPVLDFGTEGWGVDGGDFNNDGNVDLAVTDRDTSGFTAGFCILLGDGTGHFTMTPESPYACGTGNPQPRFAEVGDFDEDGALDIAVAAVAEGDVYIFTGDGGSMPDGTFTEHPGSPIALGDVMHLDSADFDEDGHVDLVVGAYGSTNVYVLLGDGTGAFTLTPQSPLDAMPGGGGLIHVSIGDFTNDGILDFLTSHWQDSVYNLFIGENAGSGVNTNANFNSPLGHIYTPIISPGLAVTGDFNGDGNLDFAQEGWNVAAQAAIMLGNGAGAFTEAPFPRLSVGDAAEYGAASDFNGDSVTDLVFTAVWSDQIFIYLGDGTGAFSYAIGSPMLAGRAPRVVYLDDFNHDAITDLAIAHQSNGELYIYLGN